jgi:hypothetical protein
MAASIIRAKPSMAIAAARGWGWGLQASKEDSDRSHDLSALFREAGITLIASKPKSPAPRLGWGDYDVRVSVVAMFWKRPGDHRAPARRRRGEGDEATSMAYSVAVAPPHAIKRLISKHFLSFRTCGAALWPVRMTRYCHLPLPFLTMFPSMHCPVPRQKTVP